MEPKLIYFEVPNAAETTPGTHRLACHEWGNPESKNVVVCVHGLTRNGRDFDYLARALVASDYRVLCPDMPGRGRSPYLKDTKGYTNAAYLADIIWMLKSQHISKVQWVGTSMGGIIGMLAVNYFPGLVDTLVLNDIGCFIPMDAIERIRAIADVKTSYRTRAEAERAFRDRSATFGIAKEEHWQHLLTHGLRERGAGMTDFTYDPAIFSEGFSRDKPAADVDLWPLWDAVTKIPVMLIRGAESDLLHRDTATEMQLRHPNLRLHEVLLTGHAPTLMEDKEITLLRDWISAKKTF